MSVTCENRRGEVARGRDGRVFLLVNQNLATASASAPSAISLIPTIDQGALHNQRVGNEVKCAKGVVTGYIN